MRTTTGQPGADAVEQQIPVGQVSPSTGEGPPPRRGVWAMFDRIAPRYDFLNRLLSLRRDVSWRKRLARFVPPGEDLFLVDLATGTADVILSLFKHAPGIGRAIGFDLARDMLSIGRQKLQRAGLSQMAELQLGDALQIPPLPTPADVVTMAFGIRNVEDPHQCLREMFRILKPGGRALILEFALPSSRLIRPLYLYYFRHILPRIGGLLSGDAYAYRYLNQTVEHFPYGQAFLEWMQQAGFVRTRFHPLTFGIAMIYIGEKPSDGLNGENAALGRSYE